MSADKLYTPELLALTVELADWPAAEALPLHGDARSKTCGSTLAMNLSLTCDERIEALGMRVRACAVGQAAAAIFARHAPGRDLAAITAAHEGIEAWLEGEAPIADWPDLSIIERARDYPGRHGAILLPWKAAMAALSSAPAAS